MLNIIRNSINRFNVSGVDPDALAFISAAGITGTTQKDAITTLVKDLKNYGLWSKMKAVYPFVTDNRNLLSYTEDFSNGFWSKQSSIITANVTTAPNGTLTADSFNDGVANDYHQVYSLINSLPIGTYTFSFYFKSNTSTKNIAIYPFATSSPGGTGTGGVILTQNGTFVANSNGGVVSYGSEDVGNGWRRFYVVGTSTAISNVYPVISFANGTNVSYAGSNTDAYIWGAQLELGSTASTYQAISTTPQAFIASQFKYNLKDPRDLDAAFRLVFNGGWTHSSTGATPNGTNGYADTKLNLLSNLPGYDSSFSVYFRQDLYGTYKIGAAGTNFDQGISAHLGWTNTSGTLYNDHLGRNSMLNSNYGSFNAFHNSSVTSTSSQKLYRNGVLKLSGSATSGITMPSINFYAGAANVNGTATYFDPKQIAFLHLGNGLTDTEATNFYYCVQKYQTSLGRNVGSPAYALPTVQDTNAKLFLSAINSADATINAAIDTFIQGLKTDGIYSKMKALYPFVGGTASSHKFNLINPQDDDSAFRLVFNGGWTHSSNGALPNGTNGYADTKLNQTVAGMFSNSHLSYYSRTNSTSSVSQVEMGVGATVAGTFANLLMRLDTTTNYIGGSVGSRNALSTLTNSIGHLIVNALSASAKAYKNGSLVATDTSTQTGSLNTLPIYIGAQNNNSISQAFSLRQVSLASIGDGLTDTEAANLYSRVQTLQSTLNRSV